MSLLVLKLTIVIDMYTYWVQVTDLLYNEIAVMGDLLCLIYCVISAWHTYFIYILQLCKLTLLFHFTRDKKKKKEMNEINYLAQNISVSEGQIVDFNLYYIDFKSCAFVYYIIMSNIPRQIGHYANTNQYICTNFVEACLLTMPYNHAL